MTTTAAEATPAGSARETFSQLLDDLVSQYIGELVDRQAVDEANGDVLDLLIDHAVAQEQARVAHESVSRREHLDAFAAHLDRERARADSNATTSRARAEAAASRVRSLLRSMCEAPVAGEKPGDPVDVAWVRAFIAERRTHWAAVEDAAIRSAGLADESQLASATDSARQRLEAAERDLAAARDRHAAAVSEKEAALLHLRGTAKQSAQDTAAPAKGDQIMKTLLNRTAVVGGAAGLAVITLAGCTAAGPELRGAPVGCELPEGAVAFAAAGRANAPGVDDSPSVVAAVNHAIEAQTHLTIIDTGGRPSIVTGGSLESKAKNGPAREDERRRLLGEVGAALQGVRSTSPEANPLEALGLAADAVRAHGPAGTVVLADSGLQTTGGLDFTTPGMLAAEPSQLAEQVKEAGQLPDLSGVTVALSGIGSTAQPQLPLDNATRERLQEQWFQLVTAAGAECVYLDEMPNTQQAPDGVPPVTPVVPPPPPEYDFDEPIPLPEDVLPFRDNSPELVDPQAARETLEPLAIALQGTTGTIRLTGTTASGGTEAGRLELSRERAETVKRLLGSLGVDASRITTEGVGTNFPGYREDLDEDGNQIEEIAKQNRLVILEVVGG